MRMPRSERSSGSARSSGCWDANHTAALCLRESRSHSLTSSIPYGMRSEEHTSELQSLMRISYAVFCLKKKKQQTETNNITNTITNTYKATNHVHQHTSY